MINSGPGRELRPIRRRPKQPIAELSALPNLRRDRVAEDREFLPAVLQILESPPPVSRALLGYALCALIATSLVWSIFSYLRSYAVATGQIEVVGRTKVIQPAAAGQVSAINVENGDEVHKGDILIELNPTVAIASRKVIADNLVNLRAEVARRLTEISAAEVDPIDTSPKVTWDSDIPAAVRDREEGVLKADLSHLRATLSDLTAQREVKEANRDALSLTMASQQALITSTSERVNMREQLEAKGWDSRARVLEALQPLKEQQVALSELQTRLSDVLAGISIIDTEIAQARALFIADQVRSRAAADRQIDDFTNQLIRAEKSVADLSLRAPVDGVVHASAVTTVGEAVSAGQTLMQIVPKETPLQIIAYVLNKDIGFVREGQPAVIKVDAFPYTRYGTIAGMVTKVATDAISGQEALGQQKNASSPPTSETTPAERTNDLVFPVYVRLSESTIDVDGDKIPLTPGLSVVVEITTGNQRAITYVLYPLVRGFGSPAIN